MPILVPEVPQDYASLDRAIEIARADGDRLHRRSRSSIPIHFGFSASLVRYHRLREAHPDIEILMGTGNLTELTDADTSGITATLLGICSELEIRNLLVVHVSPHTRAHGRGTRCGAAHAVSRRAPTTPCRAAIPSALLQVHDVKPHAATPQELAEQAATIRDRNYRIETAADGVHLYNRDAHVSCDRRLRVLPRTRGRGRRRPRLLSRRRTAEGRDRLAARQALCAGYAASTSASPRRGARRTAPVWRKPVTR